MINTKKLLLCYKKSKKKIKCSLYNLYGNYLSYITIKLNYDDIYNIYKIMLEWNKTVKNS